MSSGDQIFLSVDQSPSPSPRRRGQERVRAWLDAQPADQKNPHASRTPSPLRHLLTELELTEPDDEHLGSDTLKVPGEAGRGSQEHLDHVILTTEQAFKNFQKGQIGSLEADYTELDRLRNSITEQFKQLDQFQDIPQNIAQLRTNFSVWEENHIENMEILNKTKEKSTNSRDSFENEIRSTQGDTSKSFNEEQNL